MSKCSYLIVAVIEGELVTHNCADVHVANSKVKHWVDIGVDPKYIACFYCPEGASMLFKKLSVTYDAQDEE